MKYSYLVTIIIPTKNRAEYAAKAAEQILSIKDDRIQLIIQDNSDEKNLEGMLSHLKTDKRLKYNYSSQILSFVDNFGLAVSLADGEYLCVIGDDDGVNPEIVELAEWASKNDIKAIKPEVQAVYYWPNAINKSEEIRNKNGYMTVSKITDKIRIVDTSGEVLDLLKNGCQRYLSLDLVKLYHGLVRKESLEGVREITGKYFGGLSPDIYSAVALSILIPKIICIDYPITISGICSKSGSADSATGKHTGDLKDAPHFQGHTNYEWSKLIPPFYSVETIWADSAIAAINDLNMTSLLKNFNLEYLSVYCQKKYKNYRSQVMNHFINEVEEHENKKNYKRVKLILAHLYIPILDFSRRALRRLKKGKRKIAYYENISNVIEAQKILEEHLHSRDLNIDKIISSIEKGIKN